MSHGSHNHLVRGRSARSLHRAHSHSMTCCTFSQHITSRNGTERRLQYSTLNNTTSISKPIRQTFAQLPYLLLEKQDTQTASKFPLKIRMPFAPARGVTVLAVGAVSPNASTPSVSSPTTSSPSEPASLERAQDCPHTTNFVRDGETDTAKMGAAHTDPDERRARAMTSFSRNVNTAFHHLVH